MRSGGRILAIEVGNPWPFLPSTSFNQQATMRVPDDKRLTAYPQTEESLRDRVKDIDRESLSRPLRRCDLRICQGTCCYDGVYLNEEETGVIRSIVEKHRQFFEDVGTPIKGDPVVPGTWAGREDGRKTAVRPFPFSSSVENYPKHFEDTKCVFLNPEGKCALQLLSVAEGRHPWFYKPATCWLHPISIINGSVMLPNEENDPHITPTYKGYSSAAPCGASCTSGEPAYRTLSAEIEFLGKICKKELLPESTT